MKAKYLAASTRILPGFPLAYIGWSVLIARQFLRWPTPVNFNMFQKTLAGPLGRGLVRDAHAAPARRAVYGWTVNEPAWMEWSIERGLDGVITDDPALFRDVCDRYEDVLDGVRPRARASPSVKRTGRKSQAPKARSPSSSKTCSCSTRRFRGRCARSPASIASAASRATS